ncbi:uncharacterized protein LOC131434022 [Malaya genurostris]|uniref:uncharacterized protein LOC131434022 n=1 Tax=Malaya genurostris TaxID=325434 RepID=UPI0026F38BA8|nr:uncharacterized protein LOC131434022 [Malaya genurostris]
MPNSKEKPGFGQRKTCQSLCTVNPNLNLRTSSESAANNAGANNFRPRSEPNVAGSRLSTTSSRARRAALDLQRLEEERRLEKEYLAKKYDLLQIQLERETDENSDITHRSSSGSKQRTQDWVDSLVVPTLSNITESLQIPVGTQSRTGAIPKTVSVSSAADLHVVVNKDVQLRNTRNNRTGSKPIPSIMNNVCGYDQQRVYEDVTMSSATVCSGAVNVLNATSPINEISSELVNLSISTTRTPDDLMDQFVELQQRMNGLQQQLAATGSQQIRQTLFADSDPVRSSTLSYKFPVSNKNVKVTSSVSQICSNTTTTIANQINVTSLPWPSNQFDTFTKTPSSTTVPRSTPQILPFMPTYISTPQSRFIPPSVHTVSSYLSPIVSPMIPTSASTSTAVSAVAADILPRQLFCGPNSQQLAARQVVPRELPAFSGDPVEWPLFLSCYQNSTEMCGYSQGENLMRLQRCLKGNALEAVRSYLMQPSSVQLIIDTLRTLYGRPELIINSLLTKVRATPCPKPERLETLVIFGLACKNFCSHLQAAGLHDHLSNPLLLQELVNKLPATIKLNWAIFKRQHDTVDLTTFGCYMDQIVIAASEVTFPNETEGSRINQIERQKLNGKLYVNAHTSESCLSKDHHKLEGKENKPKPCVVCQSEGHRIKDCPAFHKMRLVDRWSFVENRMLCRRCLFFHGKFPCKAKTCGENGCNDRHHKLLHPGKPQSTSTIVRTQATNTITIHRQLQQTAMFRIIPVFLHGNGKSIQTYAFLDDDSAKTLVDSAIAEVLGVSGDVHPLCLQWTSGIERTEENSQLIRLEISGVNNANKYTINDIHTVKNLNLPDQSLHYGNLCKQFPHLRGLPVQSYEAAVPSILIGLDNSFLMASRKIKEGTRGNPIASKTRLGWTVYGTKPTGIEFPVHRLLHIKARSSEQELHELVQEFFAMESVGITSKVMESDDDRRARMILESTTVRTASGKFQTGLLWKYDRVEFLNSRPMAEKRLLSLERRLALKPDLYDNVRHQLSEYQKKGYAHKVDQQELASFDPKRTWYLPLNVVSNPRKPNKVRLVWDAAAKVQGQSFNSALLAGPDLMTPLPKVLCPFRQFEVAISADICEMFHQIFIRSEDRSAQLFLWRDDTCTDFDVFAMDVATFGSTCSPSAAQFVKNRNAEEFAEQYPLASEAIIKHHYVDDFLYSAHTEEEMIRLALQVKLVHSKAGFNIRNWLSNSPNVSVRVGEQQAEPSVKFVDKSTVYERVLGMIWKPESDVFVFQGVFREEIQNLLCNEVAPTKREVLRVVMSIFDPIGLVAVFVVHGKLLIQQIWRNGLSWDEHIRDQMLLQWKRWIKLLQELEQVQITRCYFPGYTPKDYSSLELHIFVDASEEAMAAVAYFRIIEGSNVRCSLVSAKTKVAPIKPLSIPKLELSAAVLGARLSKSVIENHTLPITRHVFWTDSRTCLSWLRSDPKKYRQFVAFRVTEILELTQIDKWRWLPSRLNVADEATKWGKEPNVNIESRWFQAPAFLYRQPDHWPKHTAKTVDTTEELRPMHLHHHIVKQQLIQFERFSKWERLVRVVAYIHRFIQILRCRIGKKKLSNPEWLNQDELKKAETTIWRLIQHETYGDEIVVLTKNRELPTEKHSRIGRSSEIAKLSPFLDDQDTLRMDGRIANAQQVSFDFKVPIILPKGHGGTRLLADWYHRQYKHGNSETAVNEMRQKFYISEMRVVIKQASKQCQWCKIYKVIPEIPRMAP